MATPLRTLRGQLVGYFRFGSVPFFGSSGDSDRLPACFAGSSVSARSVRGHRVRTASSRRICSRTLNAQR